jgi:hypothetical protein
MFESNRLKKVEEIVSVRVFMTFFLCSPNHHARDTVHLASYNNPRAAIPTCTNKPDNMELHGKIPILTHVSHGTNTLVICRKSPDSLTKAEQKLSPRNSLLRKESQGEQLHAKGKATLSH